MSGTTLIRGMQSRQRPVVGDAGCRCLEEAVVAQAGMGGVGALALELFARAGVRRFRILDMDVYDASNLNRQVFATSETLGRPKVEVAAERILAINPDIEIEQVVHGPVTPENARTFLEGATVGVVCTDGPSSQVYLGRVAAELKLRLVVGWSSGMGAGVWVETFDVPAGPLRRGLRGLQKRVSRLLGRPHVANHELSNHEAEAMDEQWRSRKEPPPSIGFAANAAACLVAATAVTYIVGQQRKCAPRVALSLDTLKAYR